MKKKVCFSGIREKRLLGELLPPPLPINSKWPSLTSCGRCGLVEGMCFGKHRSCFQLLVNVSGWVYVFQTSLLILVHYRSYYVFTLKILKPLFSTCRLHSDERNLQLGHDALLLKDIAWDVSHPLLHIR